MMADILSKLGLALHDQGNLEEAIEHFNHALEIYEVEVGEGSLKAADALNNLGLLRQDQDEFANAIELFKRVFRICRKVLGNQDLRTREVMDNLAMAYSHLAKVRKQRWSVH